MSVRIHGLRGALLVVPTTDAIADLRRRLRTAGLSKVVAPVAARVDVGPDGVAEYSLLALVKLGPQEKKRIAEVMGAARYTIDTRRFSDGYWSDTR
jgi:hypothetical protein